MIARKPTILVVFWPLSDYQTIAIAAANIRVRNGDSHLQRHVLLSKQNIIRKKKKKEAMIRKILFSMIREVAVPPLAG